MPTQFSQAEPVSRAKQLVKYSAESTERPIRLKLDANEGPAVDRGLFDLPLEAIRRYPDCRPLEQALATRLGVVPEQVMVTAGGDDAIDRVCRTFLEPGRNLIFPEPSFAMIRTYGLMAGAEVRSVDWQHEFPVDEIVELSDSNTSIVAVVSPNNPTGKVVDAEALAQLADALPQSLLLIDQAYAEFDTVENEESLTQFALDNLPNAIVIRTFSKAWGLAGLRVGCAVGSVDSIKLLRSFGGPYPVSGLSLAIAEKCVREQPEGQAEYLRQVASERDQLAELLRSAGCSVSESKANFVFAQFDNCRLNAQFVFTALTNAGILVRRFSDLNALRITCPDCESDFTTLMNALKTILCPKAILFDMDGVLVDESPSYREAIRLTCQAFGVEISADEIANEKMAGGTNNDWLFTQKLLRDRGCEVELEPVKTQFELFYQGDDENEGLWKQEVRLVDRDWLQDLASRYPLAIVTGRPRLDAERFLQSENLLEFFSAVVCMEDGPAKPDPANVSNALEQLDVGSAWMIGDTPDDTKAADQAGLVAIGIVAPTDERELAKSKLIQAGAVCVVESLQEFGRLLP